MDVQVNESAPPTGRWARVAQDELDVSVFRSGYVMARVGFGDMSARLTGSAADVVARWTDLAVGLGLPFTADDVAMAIRLGEAALAAETEAA